jgi:hypothetical protein
MTWRKQNILMNLFSALEDDLKENFLEKMFANQSSDAHQQTVGITALIVSFFSVFAGYDESRVAVVHNNQRQHVRNNFEGDVKNVSIVSAQDNQRTEKYSQDPQVDKLLPFEHLGKEFQTWFGNSPDIEAESNLLVTRLIRAGIDHNR